MRFHPKSATLVLTVLAGAGSIAACGDTTRAETKAESNARYSYYESKEYLHDQREDFQADMQRAIDKLEARTEELRAKASRGGEKVKAETQELIDDIEARLPELRRNLAEAKDATREGWQDFKRKFQDTFDDLGNRLDRAFD